MLEVICTSCEDIVNAIKGGADRIELIDNIHIGGTTPSFDLIKKALSYDVQINVMLRCRGGNFTYSESEIQAMKKDARLMKSMGVRCVVFGALDSNGKVDINVLDRVVGSNRLYMTFHRAIDESSNIIKNVNILNDIVYVKNILTSGGIGKAYENMDTINKLIEVSDKKIIVGSGINIESIQEIKRHLIGSYDIHVGSGVRVDGFVSEKHVRKLRRFET